MEWNVSRCFDGRVKHPRSKYTKRRLFRQEITVLLEIATASGFIDALFEVSISRFFIQSDDVGGHIE